MLIIVIIRTKIYNIGNLGIYLILGNEYQMLIINRLKINIGLKNTFFININKKYNV